MRQFRRESELTSDGLKKAIADNIMPILTQLAEFFRDGFPTVVMAFRYSLATITSLVFGLKTSFYIVAESILGSVDAIGLSLSGLAKASARAMVGDFSGAKQTEHACDTSLFLRGSKGERRTLECTQKNRFGSTPGYACFAMREEGMVEVPPPDDGDRGALAPVEAHP